MSRNSALRSGRSADRQAGAANGNLLRADVDRQTRWRCRRGMKELDVVFERYLACRYHMANEDERAAFRRLLDEEDPVLWAWVSGAVPVSDRALEQIVDVVRSCH